MPFISLRSFPRSPAPWIVLVVAALVSAACSSSHPSTNAGGGGDAGPSQAQVTAIADNLLATTEGFLARFSAAPASDDRRFVPEGNGTMTFPCVVSGSVTVTQSVIGGATAAQTITVDYAACDEGTYGFSGAFTSSCASNASSVEETFDGTIGVVTYSSTGAIEQTNNYTFVNFTRTFSTSGGPSTAGGAVQVDGATYAGLGFDYDAGSPPICPGTPASNAGDGGNGGGVCGSGATGCSIVVCPSETDCTGSGISMKTYSCGAVIAQYDDASGLTSIPVLDCLSDTIPTAAISITGKISATTYTSTNPLVEGSAIFCAGSETGAYWGAGPGAAEDGGALGGFTLTLTSVTQAMTGNTTTEYVIHGSLQVQCVGGPTEDGSPPASGNVGMTVTF